MPMHKIEFAFWTNPNGVDLTGYNANDFLPGFGGRLFDSAETAELYIEDHDLGPDSEGVYAEFDVVLADDVDIAAAEAVA